MNTPKTMKAAILVKQNKPLIVDQVELPQSLEVGQVLVKIHSSGICGSQLGEIDGVKGEDPFLPHLLGHEGSGSVMKIGPGVQFVKPDDNVVLHWRKSQGIDSVPPIYKWNGNKLNAGSLTTFNEYAIVSENRLTKVSNFQNQEVASLFGCAVLTGFGVIENNAKVRIGESIVVFGSGGVGLNMIQAAASSSMYPIIAVDLHDSRLELAKECGASHVINSKSQDAKVLIKQFLEGDELDVFIDNTGQPSIIEMGYSLTSQQGRVVLVGVPSKENNINIHTLPLHFGKTIIGSHGGEATPHLDIPRYQKLIRNDIANFSFLITERYNLEDINLAIQRMRNGELAGRCVINMEK